MRKLIPALFVFLFSILSFQHTNAQLAVIKDPDGHSNIRERANVQSKVQDTLSNGRLVYILPEDAPANWLSIDYNKGEKYCTGFIHKSRVVPLQSMAAFKATSVNDTLLKLAMNDMLITIKTGKFVKAGRKIVYFKADGEYQEVNTIDGKQSWGFWGFASEEYKFIQLKSGAQTLTFTKTQYNDLFSPNLRHTLACFDNATNTIYLVADNGDASLSYTLVWAIKNGQIVKREVFAPY